MMVMANARIMIARERDRGMIRAVGTNQSRCTQCRLERHACEQHNDYDAAKRIHLYSVPETNAYGPVGLNIEATLRFYSSIDRFHFWTEQHNRGFESPRSHR